MSDIDELYCKKHPGLFKHECDCISYKKLTKDQEITELKKKLRGLIETLLEYEENHHIDDIYCAVYDIFLIHRKIISREFLKGLG